jgi:Acetyltransferase (GNAT) domain
MESSIAANMHVKSSTGRNLHVKVFRSFVEIETVSKAWRDWQSHPNSDIDFCRTIHAIRPEILHPQVYAIYRDGIIDALLIGRIEEVHVGRDFGYVKVLNPKARRLTLIHAGFLGNKSTDNAELFVKEILASLRRGEADLAVVSHINTNSPLFKAAAQTPGFMTRDHRVSTQLHRSMEVPGSVEELYQRFSGKVRKNLKWQNKKFVTDFENQVHIEMFRDHAELDQMFRDIEQVAQKTYQRGLGVGFMDTPEMRSRMKLSADKGWLRAFVVYVRERPCAFWVGTLYNEVFHSDFMGFDREYAKYSPGMFLVLKTIEGFCEVQPQSIVKEINFGLGDAQYKEILATREWREAFVSIFAPTVAGIRLNLMLTPFALLADWMKSLLAGSGFLQKVKSNWRRKIAQKTKASS